MSFTVELLSDSLTNIKKKAASLTVEAEYVEISVSSQTIRLDYAQIIGVTFANPPVHSFWNQFLKKCCGNPNVLQEAVYSISLAPTEHLALFSVDLTKNAKGDIEKSQFRQIYIKASDAIQIREAIRSKLGYFGSHLQGKLILFVVNPFSGTRKAPKIFTEIVHPMLTMAGLENEFEYLETEYLGHCTKIAKELNLHKYRAIVTISGDGLLHEALNGLLSRPDWEEAAKMPVGTIAGGTSNAMGKNLDTVDPILAALNVINGHTRKIDILSVIQGQTVTYSHLSFNWALIADIDIESEKFRHLGELRMTVMAIALLAKLRSYKGNLYILPADKAASFALQKEGHIKYEGPLCTYTAPESSEYKQWPVIKESQFQYLLARMDDGLIDLVYAENLKQSDALASVLDSSSGKHLGIPSMTQLKVKAFALEPFGHDQTNGQNLSNLILDLSGERIPYEPVQVEIHPSLVNIIAPKWLDDERWSRNFRTANHSIHLQ